MIAKKKVAKAKTAKAKPSKKAVDLTPCLNDIDKVLKKYNVRAPLLALKTEDGMTVRGESTEHELVLILQGMLSHPEVKDAMQKALFMSL